LIHGEAALGGNLLEREATLRVLLKVLARSGYGAAVFFSKFLVFFVDHHFKQMNDGSELTEVKMAEQLMGFGLQGISRHIFLALHITYPLSIQTRLTSFLDLQPKTAATPAMAPRLFYFHPSKGQSHVNRKSNRS
jgi:hypothetical protein